MTNWLDDCKAANEEIDAAERQHTSAKWRAYYQSHREHECARQRAYRQHHKVELTAYQHDYYLRHRARKLAYQSKRRSAQQNSRLTASALIDSQSITVVE